ncbi:MAG TPA: STAS domain-containing protein [Thermoleophilaceae bacterium]|nr:STAS domain-containing protein [Thermoleophilaceae bacterium]
MSTTADIGIERRGEWIVARLGGELDMTNCSYVRDELMRSIPGSADGLVVDLSTTVYLDSAAIELLFELARRLGRHRQGLRIAMPGDSPLRRVIELTDVRAVAAVHPTVDAAVASGQ